MKTMTRAATEWLDAQVAKAKNSPNMTTIKVADGGRLDKETVADYFGRKGFEVNVGEGCVHVTPKGKTKRA